MSHAPVAPKEERTALGLGLMALGVTFMTCIDTSAKWLLLAGVPVVQIVFMRYAVALVLALGWFLPREGVPVLRSRRPLLQLLRSFALLGSTACNFAALQFLPITMTTTIMFAGPIAVTLLSIPVLGETVGIRRVAAVCTGFFGVMVVVQPWGAEFDPAVLLSVGAMLSASVYYIVTRMIAGSESISTSQVWSTGLATLAFAPVALAQWTWPESLGTGLVLLLVGVFGGTAHTLATMAHRYADASILAPVVYVQIVQAAIAGILVFGTWPTQWTLLGGAIIAGSSWYIIQRERAARRGL
ncbi:DMT family transporter [Poseidonocella sp. HB161398]|uniref:DMT family transporter n=1 Tax=Poseidonocella sp. HB161398 TaxID=2320855 RepID=UPI001F0D8C85|nr:DMT family transporter [Poseidonocella sp. HB161398]